MRLQDVPAFAALGEIAKELGVEFTLFGGAATRVWAYTVARPDHAFDLFDLTPFASDIDLAHNASAERTDEIGAAVRETVPFAPWCRWALLDAEAAARAERNRAMSTEVPLRRLILSTAQDHVLPDEVRDDLERGVVRISRIPAYESSEFARKGRDVELFGLLLALNTQADLREIAGVGQVSLRNGQIGDWIGSAEAADNLRTIAGSDALVNRLWTKLANYRVRTGQNTDPIYADLLDRVLGHDVFRRLDVDTKAVFVDDAPITVSRPTSAGGFRVPDLSPNVVVDAEAREALDAYYGELRLADFYGVPKPLIDPAFELVAFVPRVTVRGETDSDDSEDIDPDDDFGSWAAEEFLHLAWTDDVSTTSRLNPDGITACLMPWSPTPEFGLSAGAAVGGILDQGDKWVRVDVRDVTRRSRREG